MTAYSPNNHLGAGISKKHVSTEFDRRSFIAVLDKRIYQGERFIVTLATIVMIFAVFLGIVWNFFSSPKGKVYALLELILGETDYLGELASTITIVCWLAACVFAVKTAKSDWPTSKYTLYGLGIGVAFLAFGKAMIILWPSGLIYSQKIALFLMLWVVMLGSSMAAYTRRHIVLQAIRKLIRDEQLRVHAALGLMVAALFTLFMAWVGWDYVWGDFGRWLSAYERADKLAAVPFPLWIITIAIPVGFGLTLARFCGHAIFIMKGIMEPVPTEEELKAAQGEIGDVADFDEFARLVAAEESERNGLEGMAWKAAAGTKKDGDDDS